MYSSSPSSPAARVGGGLPVVERRLAQIFAASCGLPCRVSASALLNSRLLRGRLSDTSGTPLSSARPLPVSVFALRIGADHVGNDRRVVVRIVADWRRPRRAAGRGAARRFGPVRVGRGGDAVLRRRQRLLSPCRRLHQFRPRLIVDRRLLLRRERQDAAQVATSAARWPSCRCRRSASPCSPDSSAAASDKRSAEQQPRRAVKILAHQIPLVTASSLPSPLQRPGTCAHAPKIRRQLGRRMCRALYLNASVRATTGGSNAAAWHFYRMPANARCVPAPPVRAAPPRRAPRHRGIPGPSRHRAVKRQERAHFVPVGKAAARPRRP